MLDGRTAYAARFKGESPRNFTPFDEISAHGREIWQGVEEAVRLAVIKPIPGWREAGAADPHGTRYDCTREQLAGGHLTDDQAAFAVASTFRNDTALEAVLAVARDRIRWLSRRLAGIEANLSSMTQHYVDAACEAYSLKLAAAGCDDVAEHVNSITIDDVARWRAERSQEIEALRRGLSAAEKSRDAAVRDANGMREELALRASKITALEADRELPPLGLPPGALQAYSDAYGAARKGANHLEAHSAALRAVLEARPRSYVTKVLLLAAPFVDHCCGEGIHPLWDGAYVDPYPVHDEMAKILEVEALNDLQKNPDAPVPESPYTVIGKTFDGVEILAPVGLPDHFTTEEIVEGIRDAIAKVRGPRTGDMADVVEAINGEAAR